MPVNEVCAADKIDDLIAVIPNASADQQVTIIGAVLETLRLFLEGVPPAKREAALDQLLQTFAYFRLLPIEQTNFSILRTVKDKDLLAAVHDGGINDPAVISAARLSAIKIFMNLLEIEPAAATADLLTSLVQEEAAPINFNVPQASAFSAAGLEINQPATVLRVFKPAPYRHREDAPRLLLVQYKGELPGGGLGPNMWGISYNDEALSVSHVLLETGEYVVVPSHSLTLASVTTPTDVPAYLLACAYIFFPLLLAKFNKLDDSREAVQALQARFGQFTQPVCFHQTDARGVASLTDVIEAAKWQFSGTAAVGAAADFPVSELADQNGVIRVVAESAAVRPYVYAVLSRHGKENELLTMRLDRPREFSALGVYLFPLRDIAVALVIPPE